MHPVRQYILFRWALYLAVILGIAAFLGTRQQVVPKFTSDVAKRLAPKKVQVPDPAVIEILNSAIAVLKGERVPFGGVDRVEPSLIALHQDITATGQKKLPIALSAIFLGPPKKFAILNGSVFEVGDTLPDGRTVKDIRADAVVLGVGEVEERFEWIPSFRVELKKPVEKKSVGGNTPAEAEAGTKTVAPSAPTADLNNLPENPTPEQALNILQELKKQQSQQK